jgi:hypothetical protein
VTIQIDEHGVRNVPAPIGEVFGGKHFPDEEHLLETIEFDFGQQIKVGDVDHDGRDPENEIDGIVGHELNQLGGKHGELIGNHHPGGALGQTKAEFEGIGVRAVGARLR